MSLSGYSSLGVGTNVPDYSVGQDRQIKNDTNWTHGSHNFKFGIDVQWIQTYNWNARNIAGVFTFSGRYTRNPVNNAGGSSVADFLLGDVDNSTISTNTRLDERATLAAGYFQDDWKVTPRLTLNLGLRYSFFRPFQAVFRNLANVDLWTNPQSPQLVLREPGNASRSFGGRVLPIFSRVSVWHINCCREKLYCARDTEFIILILGLLRLVTPHLGL